ncbi:glutamate receptor ionotropic, kainate 2-like isoform X2 [Tigriopus californicus]|uniref:glutamate receptor ionotropic, kainate 2-like isoform X2 n=1 Tax=Tigriopus californicus TaxID=6832 RepID=UPI0027DA5227|nr:glutamate receptor ionotropic, kainate 2-like isoform X2 [Tigriopus californicus]
MVLLPIVILLMGLGVPLSLGQLAPVPDIIRLGALFDGTEVTPLEAAFIHGINMVNDDRSILIRSRLTSAIDKVPQSDSFKASKKVCQMATSGLAAIFGPSVPSTANHIQSISDTFHIPHIETRWDYSFDRGDYAINIHPHPSSLSKAYADLVKAFGWKSLVLLYENEESMIKLQEVLKYPRHVDTIRLTVRQLYTDTDDYRPLLKEIKTSGATKIVLDCAFNKIEKVLKQADEIGLISDYHSFLITSLDLERVDFSPYKRSNVNITGFRMIDPASPQVSHYLKKWNYRAGDGKGEFHPLYSENILMYDSVRVVAKAMDDLAQIEGFSLNPISCRRSQPLEYGPKLAEYIRRVEYMGLSGEVFFDADGFRTDFQLDLLEKRRDHMYKIGIWTPDVGINVTLTQSEVEGQIVEKLQNKTLRITTSDTTPFIMKKALDVPKEALERMSFEEKYEGYVIDLVKELAKALKFKYKFHMVMDGKYGNVDPKTGEWNGMIRELQDQKADMAVIDLSITLERQSAVDFTMPFMNTGVGILYKKKAPPAPNLFSFLSPLSLDVWIYMTTAYLAISIQMFLLARIAPQEWEAPIPCFSDPPELENILTLHNCFWHNWGSLMQQGSDIAPKAISTRMVAGMWWFFTLIMISSYTANLAAFLTAAKMDVPINSADDLAKQTKIKYGTYCCGSTNSFFRGSTIPTYTKLNAFMESAKPSVYTSGNQEGIERVRKEEGAYAFFMEGAAIEYHVERTCDLTQIGGLLDSKGYGIALPPDSPYTSTVSNGILYLQEAGILQQLKIKWWKEMHGGGKCTGSGGEDSAQLGLPNLGGVFIVLLAGMIASCIIAIIEFVWKKRILLQDENESLLAEMWGDFKFAVDLRASDTKPVPKEGSRAGSKSILNDGSHYGTNILEGDREGRKTDHPDDESPYATFNDNYSTTKSHKG